MAAKTTLQGQLDRIDKLGAVSGSMDRYWADIQRVEAAWPKGAKIKWKSAYETACRRFPEGVSFYWLDKRVAYLEGVLTTLGALDARG